MSVVQCSNCGIKNRVEKERAERAEARCGRCGSPLDLDHVAPETDTSKPLIVTDSTFQRDVVGVRDRPVLLDAWAPWCGPCRMIAPALEELAAESNGKYVIAKLNVDENPRVASEFHIQSIPTMLIFKNGELIDRIVGAQPKKAIAARLAKAA